MNVFEFSSSWATHKSPLCQTALWACSRNPLPSGVWHPCLGWSAAPPAGRPRHSQGDRLLGVRDWEKCGRSASLVTAARALFPTPGTQASREAGVQLETFLGMVPDKLPVPDFSCCPTGQVASPRIRKVPAGGLETTGRSALWYEPLCGYSCLGLWTGAQIDPGSVGGRAPAVRSLFCSVTGRVLLCLYGTEFFLHIAAGPLNRRSTGSKWPSSVLKPLQAQGGLVSLPTVYRV